MTHSSDPRAGGPGHNLQNRHGLRRILLSVRHLCQLGLRRETVIENTKRRHQYDYWK